MKNITETRRVRPAQREAEQDANGIPQSRDAWRDTYLSEPENALRRATAEMNDELAHWIEDQIPEAIGASDYGPEDIRFYFFGDPLETTCNSNLNDGIEYGVHACLCIELDGKHNKLRVEKVDGSVVEFGEAATIDLDVYGIAQNQNLAEALVELGERLKPLVAARRRLYGARLKVPLFDNLP